MKVTIDGIPVDAEPGTSILNAARLIGAMLFRRLCATIQSWKAAAENAVPVWCR